MSKNVTISDEDLRSLFNNKVKKGGRNQYICTCPLCGKADHFYINITSQLFDCKRCGEEGNIIKLLKLLDKVFLLGDFKSVKRGKVRLLGEKDSEDEEEIDLTPETRKLPIGFKRLTSDKYWNERGFDDYDFEKHEIGETRLLGKFKDYSIITIKEDGRNVGYLARIKFTKDEIKNIEKKTGKKVPRYKNDKGAKFSNLLLGFDEITTGTDTVILLEGFPDKVTLDKILKLDSQEGIKCCCTFGKKISKSQVLKLLSKGIRNVILIFDYDAIKEMKKQGAMLQEHFEQVLIGFTYERDLNDSTETEVLNLFNNLKTVENFKRKIVKTL